MTYEGAYASWVPPPDPSLIPAEPPPPPPKGKKGNAVEPEPEEPKEPPKLVKQVRTMHTLSKAASELHFGRAFFAAVFTHSLVQGASRASCEGACWVQNSVG